MRPVSKDARHAYPIRKQPKSASYLLAGQAFTKFYGIETGTGREFEPALKGDILVFELANGIDLPPRKARSAGARRGDSDDR